MLLKAPQNVFSLIEAVVTDDPACLNMVHYLANADGSECDGYDEMVNATCCCLIGWVLALTPGGLQALDSDCEDPLELANDALEAAGKPPLPWGIVMGTEQDALLLIRGRSAEERQLNSN